MDTNFLKLLYELQEWDAKNVNEILTKYDAEDFAGYLEKWLENEGLLSRDGLKHYSWNPGIRRLERLERDVERDQAIFFGWFKRSRELEGEPDAEALKILRNPELFKTITEREFDKKIVGEIESRKTIFLSTCGRLVKNASLTSFNVLINSKSGAGKDYITSKVLEIYPKILYEKRSRISPTALTYWHNAHYEPDWTWEGKIAFFKDISNNVANSDVFKLYLSDETSSVITIKQRAYEIDIIGKPVVLVTSANASLESEMLRRFNLLPLNESIDQTKAIIERQAELAQDGTEPEYDKGITNALRYLKPVKVQIPFAKKVSLIFMDSPNIILRTSFNRFLDYIKASAAFHQYQRERNDNGVLIANGSDYNLARLAFLKTTANRELIPLTRHQTKILDVFRELGVGNYSVSDLSPKVTFISQKTLYIELDRLADNGFLQKDNEERESSKRPIMVYSFIDSPEANLPLFKDLNCEIITIDKFDKNNTISKIASNDETLETFETLFHNTSLRNSDKPQIIIDICRYLGYSELEKIKQTAAVVGLDGDNVESLLEKLTTKGDLFQPRPDSWRVA